MYAFEFPLSIYIVNFYNISKRWNLVAISISYKVQVFSKRWFLFSTTKRHGLIESNHIYNTANSFFLFTISIKMKQVCKKNVYREKRSFLVPVIVGIKQNSVDDVGLYGHSPCQCMINLCLSEQKCPFTFVVFTASCL